METLTPKTIIVNGRTVDSFDALKIGGHKVLRDYRRVTRAGTRIKPCDILLYIDGSNFEWANGLVGATVKHAEGLQKTYFVFRKAKKPKRPAVATPSKALTYDDGKEPLAHLPWAAIDSLAQTQAYGHKKYGDFNNYRKGMEVTRNLSCALRHIRDYLNGSDKDHESGLNPLSHAFARIAFVLQNLHDGVAVDDRFKKAAS